MNVLKSLDDVDYRGNTHCGCAHRCTYYAKSLLDISASVLVRNLPAIEYAVTFMPAELYEPLMRACVLGSHLLASRELVWNWPFRVMNFKNLLPADNPVCRQKLKYAFREYEKCIGSIIIRTIGDLKNEKLKLVDLRDFDLDQRMTNVIGLIAAKPLLERDQVEGRDRLITLAEKAIRLQPLSEPPAEDPLILHVDCVVEQDNVDVVTVAMAVHRVSPISMKCCKLVAKHIGFMKLIGILRSLDPDYCQGVNITMNSLQCTGLLNILPDLVKLKKLKALGISYNLLDFTKEGAVFQRAAGALKNALAGFHYLNRLDLSNNRIGGSLKKLISNIKQRLEYLDLSMCSLTDDDLEYLGTCDRIGVLRELDLSRNNLSREPELLYKLIRHIEGSVEHLSLNRCQLFKVDHLGHRLSLACRSCLKLRTISVMQNRLKEDDYLNIMEKCTLITSVDNLYISMPVDHFDGEGNLIEERKRQFFENVKRVLHENSSTANQHFCLNMDEQDQD
ncbi:leucine-rich repeat-containing protein 14-like [Ptychodera flava]|uniref:leucine-rich repeat-containing protein 14-like n=1 Tax=Ptychodera flava TaxID=63121 RepID=UPI00396A8913